MLISWNSIFRNILEFQKMKIYIPNEFEILNNLKNVEISKIYILKNVGILEVHISKKY